MNQANVGARGQLPRIALAVALVVTTTWCTSSMASDDDRDHDSTHRDHVRISGSPQDSVKVGHEFAFKPSASDEDHRTLMFAISHKPSWASFDTRTGELSGKPSAKSVGTYRDIVIAASDGWRTAKLPEFKLHVLPEPEPTPPKPPAPKPTPTPTPQPDPTIAGTPSTSDVAGNAYSFQPSASGPSGVTLAFSVKNKPSWATFSIATGRLSGTPTATQAGTYSNIIVSVSDGKGSAALPGFDITVKAPGSTQPQPSTGTAVINWTPPTDNINGTPLTDLAGVRIYYGTSESNLNQSVQLASNQKSYTISNLTAGVWYFAGVTVTSSGEQSPMSSPVGASIP
jgi:Putative Ig domain